MAQTCCKTCRECTISWDLPDKAVYKCQATKEYMLDENDLFDIVKCKHYVPNSETYILDENDYYYRYKDVSE